jgi:hypothetical protein
MISQSEITYDVFISDPIPQAVATLLPNGDHQMWSPISSTLIYGPTEAVLIDPPITIKQTEALSRSDTQLDGGRRTPVDVLRVSAGHASLHSDHERH